MSVADTGIGIAPDKLERIFESFTQADSPTTREFGGTGLGLTISRRLAEAMGGRLWAESEVGKGSRFHLTLPLLRALSKRTGPLALVHFDAHLDTWPDSFGATYGHGSVFFHAIEESLVDPKRMIQIGIRSPADQPIIEWTRAKGVNILSAEDVHTSSPAAVADRIREVVGSAPAYLSFDIDALDPSQAPGTGTPEIGGLTVIQAIEIIRGCRGLNLVGADLVEVSPPFDTTGTTAITAANLLYEMLCVLPGVKYKR